MEAVVNGHGTERRKMPRVSRGDQHHVRSARVRPGHCALVVDISAGGALIETDCRLAPGSVVEIQMETDVRRFCVRGRVLRCAVSELHAAGVKYRGAIMFDRHLPWFAGEPGYAVPGAEQRAGRWERAETTHPVT